MRALKMPGKLSYEDVQSFIIDKGDVLISDKYIMNSTICLEELLNLMSMR